MKKYWPYITVAIIAAAIIGMLWYDKWQERENFRKSLYSADGFHYYELPGGCGHPDADPDFKHKGE